jgi:hypothetical protein
VAYHSSSKATEGKNSIVAACRVCRLHLEKTKLSGCAERKLKKAQATQGCTGGIQQPAHTGIPKPGGTPTKMPKRPRSVGGTPTYAVNPLKKPRNFIGPGAYREALTDVSIAVLKENYPQNKLSEEDQEITLSEIVGGIWKNTQGRTPVTQITDWRAYSSG